MKRNKIKLPVWIIIMLIMVANMAIITAINIYITSVTIEKTLYEMANYSITTTGNYPDWFVEWQNTVYLQEHMEE